MASNQNPGIASQKMFIPAITQNAASGEASMKAIPTRQGQPNTALASYRIFRNLHRLHSQFASVAGAFKPDLATDGDVTDSDMDDDNDSDADHHDSDRDHRSGDDRSIHSQHTDDRSIHSTEDSNGHDEHHDAAPINSNNQNDEAQNDRDAGSRHNGSSQSHPRLPHTLPNTRSAKPSELYAATSVAAATSTATPRQAGITTAPKIDAASVTATSTPATSAQLTDAKPIQTATAHSSAIQPTQPASAKPAAANTVAAASSTPLADQSIYGTTPVNMPPQFQIIKVRKPDGSIVKVRRPIKSGAAGTTASATPVKSDATKPRPEASKAQPEATEFEIKPAQPNSGMKAEPSTAPETTVREIESEVVVDETEKHDEGSDEAPKTRPIGTLTLARRTTRATQIIIWAIMIAFPLLFIILAILTAAVTSQPENSSFGKGITQANKISVSLWPIVFAAIAAQALRMFASYKVERGLRMMTLEQLINSHSLASAIKQPFLLQRLNWVSFLLLGLWCLSPLAGQAILRMSYIDYDGGVHNITLQYLNVSVDPIGFTPGHITSYWLPETNSLFGAAILAPIKDQHMAMDSWGNVKIPVLENLNTTYENGWYTVGDSASYSSLVGVPIAGLTDDGGNTSFTIESCYFTYNCPAFQELTREDVLARANATGEIRENDSESLLLAIRRSGKDTMSGNLSFASIRPTQNANGSQLFAYKLCTFDRSYVESHINCNGKSCAVDMMRRSLAVTSTTIDYTMYTGFAYYYIYLVQFGSSFIGRPHASLTEFWINDPASAGVKDADIDLFTLPTDLFNSRLARILNTYWQIGISPSDQGGYLDVSSNMGAGVNSTIALATSTNMVYHTSWGWLTLLLISGVILLVGSVAGAICDSQTLGPDIFGFASSLARRNKYMKVPDGGSTMSGPERARMLGDVQVMLQDAEVGKVALGTVDGGGKRLQKGRLYR